MDCCHSGSNTRVFNPPDAPVIPRYLPNPYLVVDDRDQDLVGTSRSVRGRRSRRRQPAGGDVHVVNLTEALIAGCRDTQTSADARIDGDFHGALTYHLVKSIRELGPEASYRQIHARTLDLLHGEYDQVPQLEGRSARLDSPFLSVRA